MSVLAASSEVGAVADLVLVLGAAAFAMLVLTRLRVPAIPALVLTGAVIGPHAVGLVPAPGALGGIAHLAIVFLMFGIGLELHMSALRPGLARLLGAGIGAVAGCVLVIWPVAAHVTGSSPIGLTIAMALSLSSTAVVLKYLGARRETTQTTGRITLAILVVQDLAVVGMRGMLPLLAQWAGTETSTAEAEGAFSTLPGAALRIGAVMALLFGGRRVAPRILSEALRSGGTEGLLLVGAAFALGSALLCHALGFSLELGAFLAGFVLADTPFHQQLSGQIAPVRDLFMAVFFVTLGMNVDPQVAIESWHWVLVGLAMVVVIKGLVIGLACWGVGVHAGTALVVAAYLAHGGEFSLVLLDTGRSVGLVDTQLHSVLIVIVVGGLLVMPALALGARRLALRMLDLPLAPGAGRTRLAHPYGNPGDEADERPIVIVVGYGLVGRRVAAEVKSAGLTPVVVDLNPSTIAALEKEGERALLGDMRSEAVLHGAGIERALALVLTVPDSDAARRTIQLVRTMRPGMWIAVRSPLARPHDDLMKAGASVVVTDEEATGEQLAALVQSNVLTHHTPTDDEVSL